MKLKHIAKYQIPLVVWVAVIYGLSAIPKIPVIKAPISVDKIAHAVMFFVLCWLGWRAFFFQSSFERLRQNALLVAFVFAGLYGVLDEIHQLNVPGRSADVGDAIADALGALLYMLWHLWRRKDVENSREDRLTESI